MGHNRFSILIILPVAALSACATPEVDRSVTGFDETAYEADLQECSDGPTWSNFFTTSETMAKGAMVGLVAGAGAAGGRNGNGDWKVVLTGLTVGSLAGFCLGASASQEEHMADIAGCLESKGYRLAEPVPTHRRDSAREFFGSAWGMQ
jgi:hypothetical protein